MNIFEKQMNSDLVKRTLNNETTYSSVVSFLVKLWSRLVQRSTKNTQEKLDL